MFRKSYVHHQEDLIVHAALYGIFFTHLLKQSSSMDDVFRAQPPCCWSRLSRGLRNGAVADLLLELRPRIPPVTWMSVSRDCCVLSVTGVPANSRSLFKRGPIVCVCVCVCVCACVSLSVTRRNNNPYTYNDKAEGVRLRKNYILTYSMEQSPSWEANRFCS